MKLTVKQLLIGSGALKRLGEKGVKILTYKIFYAVSKNISHIDKEIDHYNKNYQRIVSEFSGPLLKNCPNCKQLLRENDWGIAPKDVQVLNKVIDDAQAVEVDIPIMTLTLTEEIIENAEIRAADLTALDWMFVLPEAEK